MARVNKTTKKDTPKEAAKKAAAAAKEAAKKGETVRRNARKKTAALGRVLKTGRSTRSAGSFPLYKNDASGCGRTALQAERDGIANAIPKTWLPLALTDQPCANQDPRGIRNNGYHCYLNSVLQTFMLMPMFLHWARTHQETEDCHWSEYRVKEVPRKKATPNCLRCEMRKLVDEYWGPNSPDDPIQLTCPPLRRIKSIAWERTPFEANRQEDANKAFNFITGYENGMGKGNAQWKREFDTIFQVQNVPIASCDNCGLETRLEPIPGIGLEAHIDNQHTTLEEAIEHEYTSDDLNRRCEIEGCTEDMKGPCHTVRWVIEAAPRILRVRHLIFSRDDYGRETKILHNLRIGETLDLTRYQEVDTVPLHYRLAGVVGHNGATTRSGH